MRALIVGLLLLAIPPLAPAANPPTGEIFGQVVVEGGGAVDGVTVELVELGQLRTTDASGTFLFANVPQGDYTLRFSFAGESLTSPVSVVAEATAVVQQLVPWKQAARRVSTAAGASRRTQKLVEAPAAVSTVDRFWMSQTSSLWNFPKTAEFALGVDSSISTLGDINFNTRGFSSSLNRRVLVLVDGRDMADGMLVAQEWDAFPYLPDDFAGAELVRGPGSALYGANAFNGVFNLTTQAPRLAPGGTLRLGGGELGTQLVHLRWAGELGKDFYLKLWGAGERRDQTSLSRVGSVEYAGVPLERAPVVEDNIRRFAGGLRLDKYLPGAVVLTLEAGTAQLEGPLFQTGIGRVEVTSSKRPYVRANLNTPHFNLHAYWDARQAEQRSLSSGARLFEDAWKAEGELQGHTSFASERGVLVGGVSYRRVSVDSADSRGQQTIVEAARKDWQWAAYAQLEYALSEIFRVMLAGRYDDSSLIEPQISPKLALVWQLAPNHSLRLKADEAFQAPNYLERFLAVPAGTPINLSALEQALAPYLGGVPLYFSSIPLLARGNHNLDVEKIKSAEIGYTGSWGWRTSLSATYYRSRLTNFVSDLLPAVNPTFSAYRPPSQLPPQVQQIILEQLRQNLPPLLLAAMTNLPDGRPAFVFSYTNFGKVDLQGVELGAEVFLTPAVQLAAAYSWLNSEVKEAPAGASLLPNSPKHRASLGLSYFGDRFEATVKGRWVDRFFWSAGVFEGPVPSYTSVDLALRVHLGGGFRLGAYSTNVFDDKHYETFGGDILGRRSVVFLEVGF